MPEEKEALTAGRRRRMRQRKGHNKYRRVVLVGNPNVGKSVIFGLLTGKYVTVSNYPGTTVEVSYGNITIGNKELLVIDSPGVNNLIPMSEDEKVTRDILLRERPEAVILVSDSKNLKRGLMLLMQLAEMEVPCILALNMEDEARARGIEIDYARLSQLLDVEVIGTVAPQRKGIHKLREAIARPRIPSIRTDYGEVIEAAAGEIAELLPDTTMSKRSIAFMILSGDESLRDWLMTNLSPEHIKTLEDIRDRAQAALKEPIAHIIGHERIQIAEKLTVQVLKTEASQLGVFAARLNRWTIHPVLGFPILLMVILGFYLFVGKLGAGVLVDFLDEVVFSTYLTPVIEKAVTTVLPIPFLQDMLVGHYGILTMALTYAVGIILPITATFFLAFGFLEDSGYLPRLAVISNKLFKIIGLNGKAILPLVLGLGCGTMATMTTRILETKRERIIATFLIALTIPCSAQLGVIFGMLGGLPIRAVLWWMGTIMLVLVFSGYLASKVLQGERPDFFIELPPLRVPAIKNIVLKTLSRIEWYLKEAVPLFALGTLILFLLDKANLLGWLEEMASPVIERFLGLPTETTGAFLMGFLRRDYGAAGLFDLARQGLMNENQVIVSLVTLTLFVPCLANFFMIIKERGMSTAFLMMGLIIPFALLVGGALNFILQQ
jgi:ferrous iron transport protein B